MSQRLNYAKVAPGASKALREMQTYMDTSELDKGLIELVYVRASQVNGCA